MSSLTHLLRDPRGLLATGLGSGLTPKAPGTAGTLVCLPIWYFLGQGLNFPSYLAALALLFIAGCFASSWVIQQISTDDPGCVVVDEWVGMGITWIPVAYWQQPHATLFYLLPAFIAFRVCDIYKFWPASWADKKLHGGFGAMLDDALAGIWGALMLAFALYLWPMAGIS